MNNNFEFDKIVIAVAIGIFTIIMSANIGSVFYVPEKSPVKRGYAVEVSEIDPAGAVAVAKGVPDVIDLSAIMSKGDAEAGKQVFTKCAVCHTINKGDPNKVGPNLWNVLGGPVTHSATFVYSEAMKKRGADGKKWGYEELYRYLYAPRQYVEGTKMAFAGLKKDEDRANLIAYLRTMADNPLPLP